MRTPTSTPESGAPEGGNQPTSPAAPLATRTPQRHPVLRPPRPRDQVVIVPEARPPSRWGLVGLIVAGSLVALLIGGIIGFVIADRRVDDRVDAATAAASLDAEAASLARIDAAQQRITSLEQREAQLQDTIDGQRRAGQVVVASRREARAQLENTRADLVVARADLDAARAGLRALRGPVVADGTHIVKVIAVGTEQSPPRIVVQVGRWFTGAEARRAAIADGVIVPGQPLPNRRYYRPGDAWSTLDPSSTATVIVRRYTGNGGQRTVTLSEFERILRRDVPWARRAAHDPFWIRVFDGEVSSLQQQRYP